MGAKSTYVFGIVGVGDTTGVAGKEYTKIEVASDGGELTTKKTLKVNDTIELVEKGTATSNLINNNTIYSDAIIIDGDIKSPRIKSIA